MEEKSARIEGRAGQRGRWGKAGCQRAIILRDPPMGKGLRIAEEQLAMGEAIWHGGRTPKRKSLTIERA